MKKTIQLLSLRCFVDISFVALKKKKRKVFLFLPQAVALSRKLLPV